jgi:hypothetical protein
VRKSVKEARDILVFSCILDLKVTLKGLGVSP